MTRNAAVVRLGARFVIAASALFAIRSAGCEEEKKTNLAPAATVLAPASAVPMGATTRTFVLDDDSKTSIEMEAPKEHIKATTHGGTGTLTIDVAELTHSKGR